MLVFDSNGAKDDCCMIDLYGENLKLIRTYALLVKE